MEVDLAVKVSEVSFDEFERRQTPRGNISLIEIQNKAFLANIFNKTEEALVVFDLGIEVNEVSFDQFERRKVPR
jgi:stalled ribosome rescue protein Dom34